MYNNFAIPNLDYLSKKPGRILCGRDTKHEEHVFVTISYFDCKDNEYSWRFDLHNNVPHNKPKILIRPHCHDTRPDFINFLQEKTYTHGTILTELNKNWNTSLLGRFLQKSEIILSLPLFCKKYENFYKQLQKVAQYNNLQNILKALKAINNSFIFINNVRNFIYKHKHFEPGNTEKQFLYIPNLWELLFYKNKLMMMPSNNDKHNESKQRYLKIINTLIQKSIAQKKSNFTPTKPTILPENIVRRTGTVTPLGVPNMFFYALDQRIDPPLFNPATNKSFDFISGAKTTNCVRFAVALIRACGLEPGPHTLLGAFSPTAILKKPNEKLNFSSMFGFSLSVLNIFSRNSGEKLLQPNLDKKFKQLCEYVKKEIMTYKIRHNKSGTFDKNLLHIFEIELKNGTTTAKEKYFNIDKNIKNMKRNINIYERCKDFIAVLDDIVNQFPLCIRYEIEKKKKIK